MKPVDPLPDPAAAPVAEPPPEETQRSYHLLGRRTEQESRRGFQVALAGAVGALCYFGFKAEVDDVMHLYLGLVIFVLSVTPMLLWLKDGGSRFPVFEPMLALCASAYALPLLSGHEQLVQYPAATITRAGYAVVLYQLSALAVYYLTRGQPGRGRFWRESILTHRVERLISHGIILATVYTVVAAFTEWIPADLGSVLRAVFNGISILCTFVIAQRWGHGELKPAERGVFGAAIVLQLFIMASGLLLISALTLCGLGLLGYLSAGRRLPWLVMGVLFVCFAVLHNGKSTMRQVYWEEEHPLPALTELPAFYLQWVQFGLQAPVLGSDESTESASSKLLERTSLMHILCLVVHYTPDRQPHLDGETYGYVLPQLIPRFFWPEKPRSHVATYRLSIYYGLQDENATFKTTIAFGLLSEAYANFGLFGAALLGGFFGFVLKKLQVLSSHSPMFSLAGLLMVLLTAWSLNAELTLAAWVSSLFQAIVVALGIPLLIRSFLGL